MKRFFLIILVFGGIFCVSCTNRTTEIAKSSVARLNTFYFASIDTIPGLGAAKFVVKELVDTGKVYNEDSIRYGTSLKKVVPKFTFAATPSSAVMMIPDSSGTYKELILSGTDTIDFTRQPIYLTLVSQDGTNKKTYEITATVHQVDPDLYTWNKLADNIYDALDEQQTLLIGDKFVMLVNNGYQTTVYESTNGADWSTVGNASAPLPSGCKVRQVISDGKSLYYTEANQIYTSSDGITWDTQDAGLSGQTVHSMLMSFNDIVWAIVEDSNGDFYLDSLNSSMQLSETQIRLDAHFPIGSFATVTFPSASQRSHALVLGGHTKDGEAINSRWAFEYSAVEDQYRIKNFTIEQPNFTSLTGASMIWYNNQLFLFGGINDDAQLQNQAMLISQDEGMNWVAPDTTKCKLPSDYTIRQKQSAIVKDQNIYLFAGQSRTENFSDVYRGRLNSIDW